MGRDVEDFYGPQKVTLRAASPIVRSWEADYSSDEAFAKSYERAVAAALARQKAAAMTLSGYAEQARQRD